MTTSDGTIPGALRMFRAQAQGLDTTDGLAEWQAVTADHWAVCRQAPLRDIPVLNDNSPPGNNGSIIHSSIPIGPRRFSTYGPTGGPSTLPTALSAPATGRETTKRCFWQPRHRIISRSTWVQPVRCFWLGHQSGSMFQVQTSRGRTETQVQMCCPVTSTNHTSLPLARQSSSTPSGRRSSH